MITFAKLIINSLKCFVFLPFLCYKTYKLLGFGKKEHFYFVELIILVIFELPYDS